jgi:hypothetical protein
MTALPQKTLLRRPEWAVAGLVTVAARVLLIHAGGWQVSNPTNSSVAINPPKNHGQNQQ